MEDTRFERQSQAFVRKMRRLARPTRPYPIPLLCMQCGGSGRILDWRCQECVDRDESHMSLCLVLIVDVIILYTLWLFIVLRAY